MLNKSLESSLIEGEDFVSKWVKESKVLMKKNKEVNEKNLKVKKSYKEYKRLSEFYQLKYHNIDLDALHSQL